MSTLPSTMPGDDDWEPWRERMRPKLEALVPADPEQEFDEEETLDFMEKVAAGYGPTETGLSMGWSIAQIERFEKDPERAAIMEMLRDAEYESVERAIMEHAKAGNATAMKLYAFNKMQHRGWADRKEVSVSGQSSMEVVLSVRQALDETMRETVALGGADAIAALQRGMLDRDDDVVDAEIID